MVVESKAVRGKVAFKKAIGLTQSGYDSAGSGGSKGGRAGGRGGDGG